MNLLRFKKDDPTYWFLSNYYPCSFVLDGIYYLNAEAAFQAQKVPLEERRQFACLMPNEAKKLGRRVQLSPDWDEVRDEAMRRVLYDAGEHQIIKLLTTADSDMTPGLTYAKRGIYVRTKGDTNYTFKSVRYLNEADIEARAARADTDTYFANK